jgi:hypothetical protein
MQNDYLLVITYINYRVKRHDVVTATWQTKMLSLKRASNFYSRHGGKRTYILGARSNAIV